MAVLCWIHAWAEIRLCGAGYAGCVVLSWLCSAGYMGWIRAWAEIGLCGAEIWLCGAGYVHEQKYGSVVLDTCMGRNMAVRCLIRGQKYGCAVLDTWAEIIMAVHAVLAVHCWIRAWAVRCWICVQRINVLDMHGQKYGSAVLEIWLCGAGCSWAE
jgi:hypothetical protein